MTERNHSITGNGRESPKIPGKSAFYLLSYPNPMELIMYLGNDMIESLPVNDRELSVPGYLGRFKRQLKQRHFQLIQETGTEPEYLVVPLRKETKKTA